MAVLGIIDLIDRDTALYVSIVVTGLVSTILHELGHVFAAIRQGDPTPRLLGRVTLDPLVHMGWFGILALLIAGLPFGATPVNPYNFRGRFGRAVVSFAGPAVNIVLALIGLTVFALVIHPEPGEGGLSLPNLQRFLFVFGVWNICLFLFNLLPIPPLDGSAIAGNLFPGYRRWAENPANQPIFLGLFLFVFFAAGKVITPLAFDIAGAWIRLFVRG